ncbi:hypothetical protein [Bordetella genomosp. 13]|uniref:hypothetical protein n=1 Tax=Bordetella genomosp. 13 TaxID=463040 RepID=UPI0011A651F3|nr:hypothetical protein [Bordetella genomosp. 13]
MQTQSAYGGESAARAEAVQQLLALAGIAATPVEAAAAARALVRLAPAGVAPRSQTRSATGDPSTGPAGVSVFGSVGAADVSVSSDVAAGPVGRGAGKAP